MGKKNLFIFIILIHLKWEHSILLLEFLVCSMQ